MEIRYWNWYIVINCAILPFLAAKPFSLNDALAAESALKTSGVALPLSTERTRFSLNKDLAKEKQRKIKFGKLLQEKLSPLKNYKTLQIKSTLKPKKARPTLRPLSRKNYHKKRETYKNDKNYFPILKNLGELLNNLLNSQPIDSYEVSKTKQKHHKYEPEGPKDRRGIVCKCALQSDSEIGESRTNKKTTVLAETVSTESPTSTSTAATPPAGDVSGIRPNKDIPILLPRDSASNRRNSHGHGEGSRTALHGSMERNIPRNFRNSKHNTRFGDEKPHTKRYEKVTHGNPRDYASSDEHGGRKFRGNTNASIGRRTSNRKKFEEDFQTNHIFAGDSTEEHSRENQFKDRRNQTKSEIFTREHVRRVRRPVSKVENGDIAESVQSKENYEESVNNDSFDNTSDKRIASGSGPPSTEAEETSATNEDMISIKGLSDIKLALHKNPKMEAPSVTIIDGYSVARDKNGQNKLSEKSIHIHA